MIKWFKFKGNGPFRDEQFVDFAAKSITENKQSLLKDDILPTIVFYGPNGGGKTSAIYSLINIKNFIVNNFLNNLPFNRNHHLKDEDVTTFEIMFLENNEELLYKLSTLNTTIIEEKYTIFKDSKSNKKGQIIFDRKKDKLEISDVNLKSMKFNNLKESIPFITYVNNFINHDDINKIYSAFKNLDAIDCNFYTGNSFIPSFPAIFMNIINWENIENNKDFFLKVFKDLEINIINLEFINNNAPKGFNALERIIVTKQDNFSNKFEQDIRQESTGTFKLLVVLNNIEQALKNGKIIIIDELDSSLHTKLLKYIIKLFQSKKTNPKGSQLIFTSHDMGTLNSDVFRRDEIYFSALNESFDANLTSLYELKIRKDINYSKQYLEGNFGNDPYIVFSMDMFCDTE